MTFFERFADALRTRTGATVFAVLMTLAIVLPGQTSMPPIDRDEPRFAQATRQMVETGDYVDIRFLDVPRHLQPAGIYWLQALSLQAVGDTEVREIWPHRVPSWLAAIATVLLTWWAGGLLFGRTAGRTAALMMGTCLIFAYEARIAKIDSTLCAVTALAQAMLASAFMARERGVKFPAWQAALFWAALGFGILLKGPVMVLVTGGTVLGLIAMERRAKWLGMLRPLWGVPLMLAVAAPWYIAIGMATDGQFFRTAVGYSVAGKIAGSHQKHGGPIGYHALLFSAVFWPASFFAWIAAPYAWLQRRDAPVRFCLAWIVPAWIVFELSGTKLPHYTLPLLPAVAMLSAAALAEADGRKWLGRPRLFAAAAVIWMIVALMFTIGIPGMRLGLEQDGSYGELLLGGFAFVLAAITLALAADGRTRAALAAMAATAFLTWTNIFGFVFGKLDHVLLSPPVMSLVEGTAPCPTSQLALLEYHEPSLVFLNGSDTKLAFTPEELVAHFNTDPACAIGLVGDGKRTAFLEAATVAGLKPVELGAVEGVNVNERGERNRLTLYRANQTGSR
ncbi:MAG: glycosyltransferase family 39 protein [Hyphomonadaceae bacterium]|nr:MAG: glycosyl transferase family protein [Caulobacteraceae bacterium]MBT9445982.1 glycosyltransferase family 39 protein [Hyphomonadaceae bacterium]TPW04050.1 MAG: glycosyl transferase family protein [Alphaproteobacteria bacterium]